MKTLLMVAAALFVSASVLDVRRASADCPRIRTVRAASPRVRAAQAVAATPARNS